MSFRQTRKHAASTSSIGHRGVTPPTPEFLPYLPKAFGGNCIYTFPVFAKSGTVEDYFSFRCFSSKDPTAVSLVIGGVQVNEVEPGKVPLTDEAIAALKSFMEQTGCPEKFQYVLDYVSYYKNQNFFTFTEIPVEHPGAQQSGNMEVYFDGIKEMTIPYEIRTEEEIEALVNCCE